ncbi:MAG: hypothetical protein F6J87_19670 [Spirulina sp. SIO3F2]|nr:hypothetical protein [Spirulina sp. SIO3F2]
MTTTITPELKRLDTPRFKIMGSYAAKQYDGQWCVTWQPNPSPFYKPIAIIAHCRNEAEAKGIKRSLQNSLNTQRRKHQQQ